MSELPKDFVSASHSVLFEDVEAHRCDVCSGPLPSNDRNDGDEQDEDEHALTGRGLLVWVRGEERRYQEPPLCASCASAIGLSALSRWEIEEDEG